MKAPAFIPEIPENRLFFQRPMICRGQKTFFSINVKYLCGACNIIVKRALIKLTPKFRVLAAGS
jgi:hypothetical protein